MITRILLSTLIFSPLHAEFLKYGFDGDFDEHFIQNPLGENLYPAQQLAGRLIYHNDESLEEDNSTIYALKNFSPAIGESWTFSAEVTIPNPVRRTDLAGDPELFVGLGCYTTKGEELRFLTHTFNLESSGTRDIKTEAGYGDIEVQESLEVLNETITLRIRYEGGIFTLFRTNQETGSDTLFSMDIDDGGFTSSPNQLDWALDNSDMLNLFLIFNSKNYPISREVPLQLDNLYFVNHGTDTEDGYVERDENLLNVEVKAFPSGFSFLQKTHDLENWITIQTLRKGIRKNLLLPSDGGKAYYRVVQGQ